MSNANYYLNWGAYHVCEQCKKRFYVMNPGEYVYKKPASVKGGSSMIYFCGWNHLRAWERENRPNEYFTGHMVCHE